tara:strand:+ start:10855 stop:11160 length:306 start_codon:yes stop_codon:yes gene_type:complete
MNNKKIVLALYKNSLKVCNKLGYTYGLWNKKYIPQSYISNRKINRIVNRNEEGVYLMNAIRNKFKKNKENEEEIDELITEGFEILKEINLILKIKESKEIT